MTQYLQALTVEMILVLKTTKTKEEMNATTPTTIIMSLKLSESFNLHSFILQRERRIYYQQIGT